jgi:hypothetical protein
MGIVYIIERKQKDQKVEFEKYFSYQYAKCKFNELSKFDYMYVILYKSETLESTI